MVAGCPKCSARYRVDADRIGPDGAKLRCTKCSAVFLVRAPKAAAQPAAESPVPAASSEPTPVTSQEDTAAEAGAASDSTLPTDFDPAKLVIIADPDEARGKASAEAIANWGLTPHLVLDGVEAMLAIQRMLPAVVILDAALPKMFGFQVCEVVKRNDSLQETVVVLVGAIHHQTRYRRDPSELYGADVYIEQPDLPDGLKPILEEAGFLGGGAASPAPPPEAEESVAPTAATSTPELNLTPPEPKVEIAPEPTPDPEPVAAATPPPAVDEDPEKTEERERAERLARIAVSEMLLYSPDKFEKASQEGNLEQALDLEIQEARALLRQRIGEEVRAERDFILEELHRVAAERGA